MVLYRRDGLIFEGLSRSSKAKALITSMLSGKMKMVKSIRREFVSMSVTILLSGTLMTITSGLM
jgi:hypothetical protein